MKHGSTMSDLFDRLDELKIVFHYGQRLIPIIQSIIDFMKETVPLLEDINSSIADSTSKIPKAKDQISNVSNATEMATTEILDIADSISVDLDKIENEIKTFKIAEEKKKQVWVKIKSLLKDNSSAVELINKYEKLDDTLIRPDSFIKIVERIKVEVYNITLSLQVQDITSQQLAAVNHLIESVRRKLSSLIMHLDENEFNELDELKLNTENTGTFNPDAEYVKSSEKQEMADLIINDNLNKTSQDEIDKLFS